MLKFLNPYVILGVGGVVIVLFLYIRFLQSSRDHWKERYDEVQATLNVERATHKQAMDENEARRARDLQEATRIRNETVQHLEERGIHDRYLWALQERVAALITDRNRMPGGQTSA